MSLQYVLAVQRGKNFLHSPLKNEVIPFQGWSLGVMERLPGWSLECHSPIRPDSCLGFKLTTREVSTSTGSGEHQSEDLGGNL